MSNRNQDWKRARQQERKNKEARRNVFSFVAAEKRETISPTHYY